MFKVRIFSIFIFCFSCMAGCVREQENLFSESAAVRLSNYIESIDSTLTNAPNGWLMQYFATSESPGYSMFIEFSDNGEVVVAAKNELVNGKYTTAKSVYDVIGDNGPVLTFNTFNDVLHLFSNPENPAGTGLEGDYEFIVSDYSDSLIHLKGKKRGTAISLIRMSEKDSWIDYFEALDKMDNDLLGAEPLYFISGKDTFYAYNGASHIFELQREGSTDVTDIPFIVTSQGLKFYSSYTTTDNKEVQMFNLSEDGTKLFAENDKNTYFVGTGTGTYFVGSHDTFAFDTTLMSDHFKIPVRDLYQQMKVRYSGKRNIDFIALSYKAGFGNSFYISTTPTITVANYKINLFSETTNQDYITIERESGVYDPNGEIFYTNVNAIESVWKELNGTYKLKSNFSKNEVRFTDINNEFRYFVVKKR